MYYSQTQGAFQINSENFSLFFCKTTWTQSHLNAKAIHLFWGMGPTHEGPPLFWTTYVVTLAKQLMRFLKNNLDEIFSIPLLVNLSSNSYFQHYMGEYFKFIKLWNIMVLGSVEDHELINVVLCNLEIKLQNILP